MLSLVLLVLAPATGFHTRHGSSTCTTRRTQLVNAAKRSDSTVYSGLYEWDGCPHRGRIQSRKQYYTVHGSAVENPSAYARAVQNNGGTPRYLFHYTAREKAKDIIDMGFLKPSIRRDTGDAVAGDGCYFTSMPPWAKAKDIINNNYDGAAGRRTDRAESCVVICVDDLPRGRNPIKVEEPRDVWLVRGKARLDLFNADAAVYLDKNSETWERPRPPAWRRRQRKNRS